MIRSQVSYGIAPATNRLSMNTGESDARLVATAESLGAVSSVQTARPSSVSAHDTCAFSDDARGGATLHAKPVLNVRTSCDYNVVMKTVGIADLKARLSEHLKWVRKGRTITVLDRDTPVAQIVPFGPAPVEVRKSTRRPKDLRLPSSLSKPTDSLAVLLDDRGHR